MGEKELFLCVVEMEVVRWSFNDSLRSELTFLEESHKASILHAVARKILVS